MGAFIGCLLIALAICCVGDRFEDKLDEYRLIADAFLSEYQDFVRGTSVEKSVGNKEP